MIKCPKCGSKNIIGWRNEYYTSYYKIDKDGFLKLDKSIGKPIYQSSSGEGLQCQDCGETFTI